MHLQELDVNYFTTPVEFDTFICNLTALQQLRALTPNAVPAGSAACASLAQLPQLREIQMSIECRAYQTLNFSWLTQVTSLLCGYGSAVILPQGNHVSLQRLEMFGPARVVGLVSATHLSRIHFTSCHYYECNCNWPVCLPFVKEISWQCHKLYEQHEHTIPMEWQNYVAWSLSLPAGKLPNWFTALQHLTMLQMDFAVSPTFPASLSNLCGLEKLIMRGLCCDLTHDIVGLAQLPHLNFLSLGSFSDPVELPSNFTEDEVEVFK